MATPIYAVGDIHGQLHMLDTVLDRIEADGGRDAQVVFLGDYVDRGKDTRGVIQRLIDGRDTGRDWVFLKGNHDRMMEWFLMDPPQQDPHLLVGFHWFHEKLGGAETVASYGITEIDGVRQYVLANAFREAVPADHVTFLQDLRLSYDRGPLFFAHAGILPGVALDQQDERDLLWIRQEFHNDTRDHGKLIVHGHTPVMQATHYGNRINLDTGAGYDHPLAVAVFEGTECWVLDENGRLPLRP